MGKAPTVNSVTKLPQDLRQDERFQKCEGVLAIFAGGVYWETLDDFWANMDSGDERYLEHRLDRILEVRAYAPHGEMHLRRSSIAQDESLCGRWICDEGIGEEYHLDEKQYLDIDENRTNSESNIYVATGGGEYVLPKAHCTRIKIRNYITYDENGMGQITDFRILGLR